MVDDSGCGDLSLRDALLQWSDQSLLEAVWKEERPFSVVRIAGLGRLQLTDAETRDKPNPNGWMAGHSWHDGLDVAWDRLLLDFRQQVERGQIYLSGVQMLPERQMTRSNIPSLWAADFRFDFLAGTVEGTGHRYVAVRATRMPADASSRGVSVPIEQTADVLVAAPRSPSQRGRRPFPLEEMIEIAIGLGGPPWPNHKTAAHMLLSGFIERYPDRPPPAERTVMDHAGEIYEQSARRASTLKP